LPGYSLDRSSLGSHSSVLNRFAEPCRSLRGFVRGSGSFAPLDKWPLARACCRLSGALGNPLSNQGIHKLYDILLPDTEAGAMIFADDEGDGRIARLLGGRLGRTKRWELERPRTQPERRAKKGEEFFIFFRCNPLKSPDSAKGIQGNASYFAWFYLDLFGFIWQKRAHWLYPPDWPRSLEPRRRHRLAVRLGLERPTGRSMAKRLFTRSIWSGGTRTVSRSRSSSSRRLMTSACS
jgi:hypothetical protein